MNFKIPVIIDSSWINTTGMLWVEKGKISKVDLLYSIKYAYIEDIYKLYVPVFTQFNKIVVPKYTLSINNNLKYWDAEFLNISIKERVTLFNLSFYQEIADMAL